MPRCLFSSSLRKSSTCLDVPGLGLTRIPSGLSCMYRASCLEARELGQFYHSCAQDTPAVALSEANVLCLHTVATVLVLLAVVSPDPPCPRNPKAKFASDCCKQNWSCLVHTYLSSVCTSPRPQNKGMSTHWCPQLRSVSNFKDL